jgi:hypothetical protein
MGGSDLSKKASEGLESCSKAIGEGGRLMSSVAAARTHTLAIGDILAPNAGWKEQVSVVFDGLTHPKFPHRLEGLTWSRVKTWFYGQARQVLWEEMRALEELRALEEARREQREFDAATHRLAIALASEGAALNRKQVAALERIKRRSAHVPRAADARSSVARRYVAVPRVSDAA